MKGSFGEVTVVDGKAIKRQKFINPIVYEKDGKEILASKKGRVSRQALRECNYLTFLNHKNIVAIEKVEFIEYDILITLPLYNRLNVLRVKNKEEIVIELLEGLIYMHDNNVVHGDIKLSNIVVDDDGSPKYIDFGTMIYEETTEVLTTNVYASPEVLIDRYTSYPADIWALGVTILEIFERRPIVMLITKLYGVIKHDEYYKYINQYVKEKYKTGFLVEMLSLDYNERPTAREVYKFLTEKECVEKIEEIEDFTMVKYPVGNITYEMKEFLIREIQGKFLHLRDDVMEFFMGNFNYYVNKHNKEMKPKEFRVRIHVLAHIVQTIFADYNQQSTKTLLNLEKELNTQGIIYCFHEMLEQFETNFMRR